MCHSHFPISYLFSLAKRYLGSDTFLVGLYYVYWQTTPTTQCNTSFHRLKNPQFSKGSERQVWQPSHRRILSVICQCRWEVATCFIFDFTFFLVELGLEPSTFDIALNCYPTPAPLLFTSLIKGSEA